MAESRGRGEERTTPSRGPQGGAKRPGTTAGSTVPAPKKGDQPHKDTMRVAPPPKAQPSKSGGLPPSRSHKPSSPRGR